VFGKPKKGKWGKEEGPSLVKRKTGQPNAREGKVLAASAAAKAGRAGIHQKKKGRINCGTLENVWGWVNPRQFKTQLLFPEGSGKKNTKSGVEARHQGQGVKEKSESGTLANAITRAGTKETVAGFKKHHGKRNGKRPPFKETKPPRLWGFSQNGVCRFRLASKMGKRGAGKGQRDRAPRPLTVDIDKLGKKLPRLKGRAFLGQWA